jgi:hypothetical protein
MAIIDQSRTYAALEERYAATTNPRHKLLLGRVLQHAKGEVAEDLEAVLGTLAPDAVYRTWSSGPAMNPRGIEEIRNFYVTEIFGKGRHCLEYNVDRITVADDAVITDGLLRTVMWGRDMKAMGMPVDDVEACYLVQYRNLITWPFNAEGFITGEESYACPVKDYITRISDADVPASFLAYVQRRRQADAAHA